MINVHQHGKGFVITDGDHQLYIFAPLNVALTEALAIANHRIRQLELTVLANAKETEDVEQIRWTDENAG